MKVKKSILPVTVLCLSAALFTAVKAKSGRPETLATSTAAIVSHVNKDIAHVDASSAEATAAALYEDLNLDDLGMTREAIVYGYKGYRNMMDKGLVRNPDVLTIIDFSQTSHNKRMYIIDLKNNKVLMNTYVAHGRNSGLDMAKSFSNVHESLQSSLGFYVTKQTYQGKHGLSLRLDGKDRGFNDNAESRAVVVHGAEYIGRHRLASAYMGRSFGCPAVPQEQAGEVINLIKNGTTLFIYHPSQKYLDGSTILNG